MEASSTRPLAVVTGASSGIGLELARQFATNGYDLIVAAEDAAIATAAQQLSGLGGQVDPVQVDLATEAGVDDKAKAVMHGKLAEPGSAEE